MKPTKQNKNNPLPSDLDSEKAVLGACLLSGLAYGTVSQIITDSKMFYWSKHQFIFEAMCRLFENGKPIDIVTVSSYLKGKDLLNEVGGDLYLVELSEGNATPRNASYYAQIVAKKFELRSIYLLTRLLDEAIEPETEPSELVDRVIGELVSITQQSNHTQVHNIKEVMFDVQTHTEQLSRNSGIKGIPCGYNAIDSLLLGFSGGDLIIIAARPSVGKTALTLNFAYNAAKAGSHVVILSLEMQSRALGQRLVSLASGIPAYSLNRGWINKEQWSQFTSTTSQIAELPIHISDTFTQHVTTIHTTARLLKLQNKLDVLIIDYLQLIDRDRYSQSDNSAISMITRRIKGIAKDLDVPVILVSQLSRSLETRGGDKRPVMSDLRDSGSIEQDADIVMLMYREAYYKRNSPGYEEPENQPVEINIAKHREGPTGHVNLLFNKNTGRFMSLEKDLDNNSPAQENHAGYQKEEYVIPF